MGNMGLRIPSGALWVGLGDEGTSVRCWRLRCGLGFGLRSLVGIRLWLDFPAAVEVEVFVLVHCMDMWLGWDELLDMVADIAVGDIGSTGTLEGTGEG